MTPTPVASTPPPDGTVPREAVLFVHIQKTAGMSLYNSMAKWFGPEHAMRYPRSTREMQERFLALPQADLDRLRLLSGHFDLAFWLRRDVGDRLLVSLVREPVERVLSSYRYMKGWTQHRRHAEVAAMSVAQMVDDHVGDPSRHNWQCRKLCGVADFRAARDMAQKHVDLLGAVEMIGLVTAALGERLGVPIDLRSDNLSPVEQPCRDDLEPALLARLQASNVEDFKLWAWVIEQNLVRGHR
jgi:uncharacterized protein with von Willebrand factor type A (vWA) domain